jgi:glycosyltransferase involved in cell wall biosynthesis
MSNKAHPKVTIMIPTYGQENLILRAIDSALEQDYPNLEIVVSDDASPDGTEQLVASRCDPRLFYHRNGQNLGRVTNYRKTLYTLATGDWVVNLDGDDYFTDKNFISEALRTIESDCSIVVACARVMVKTGENATVTRIPPETKLAGSEVVLRYVDDRYRFAHMAAIYKRSLALETGFYRMDVLSADWESLCRLAVKGKVAYLDRIAGVWCVDGENATGTHDWRLWSDNLLIWPSIAASLRNAGFPKHVVRWTQAKLISHFACLYFGSVLKGGILGVFSYLFAVSKIDFPAFVFFTGCVLMCWLRGLVRVLFFRNRFIV